MTDGVYLSLDYPEACDPGAYCFTSATGINNSGQIVGQYEYAGPHCYLLSGGAYTSFNYLPGGDDTYPTGINDSGQIVGMDIQLSFLLSGGNYSSIAYPGAYWTQAMGINNSGQIVGAYQDAVYGNQWAFLLTGNTYTQLMSCFSMGGAGINNSGQIVISCEEAGEVFLLSGGTQSNLSFPHGLVAAGINDSGMIVGGTGGGGFVAIPVN